MIQNYSAFFTEKDRTGRSGVKRKVNLYQLNSLSSKCFTLALGCIVMYSSGLEISLLLSKGHVHKGTHEALEK